MPNPGEQAPALPAPRARTCGPFTLPVGLFLQCQPPLLPGLFREQWPAASGHCLVRSVKHEKCHERASDEADAAVSAAVRPRLGGAGPLCPYPSVR
jgi:hypothetical protein